MKKNLLLLTLVIMTITLASCNQNNTALQNNNEQTVTEEKVEVREFTDSLGRTVIIPKNITKIAATGNLSQIALLSIAQDKFIGLASKLSDESKKYFDENFANLPVLGQLYGGKGDLNLESVIQSNAELVIDIGEPKGSIKEDLDKLSEQTGIPFIHITFTLESVEDCFNKLGELFDRQDRAKQIINYCNETLSQAEELTKKLDKKTLAYCIGQKGLNVIAEKSYFSEVINLVTENAIKIDEPSSKGTGNEIDIEQLINFNPEYIVFEEKSMYDNVSTYPEWSDINAIKNKNYYLVPTVPYNILGFPPSIQKIIGTKWLMSILYKNDISFDINDEFIKFYKLFYNINLSAEDLKKILYIE